MGFLQRIAKSLGLKAATPSDDPRAVAGLKLIEAGQAAEKRGQLDEALRLYMSAVETAPRLARAHMNLGNAQLALNLVDRAMDSYRTAVELGPDYAPAHYNLGNGHWRLVQNEAALRCYLNATNLDPTFVLPWIAIANTLGGMGKFDEAIDACRHAISLEHDNAESHLMLGLLFKEKGLIDESIESVRKAVELHVDHPFALPTLAELLSSAFRFKEAQDCVRRAIQIAPQATRFRTALLFLLSEDDSVGTEELFREHVAAGQQIVEREAGRRCTHVRSTEPERTLRVGFMSGDFNNHPVSYFTTSIFRCLSKRTDVSLYAYSNSSIEDDVTRVVQPLFHHWRQCATMDDDTLEAQIRHDGIDVLIDLSGHTKANRMAVMARKPAPIQASWIGYAGTTGMEAIDYYLADRQFLPLAEFESQFVEKLVHLPANGSFQPLAAGHVVNPLPSLATKTFTFGSFNRPSKINRRVVATWAGLLRGCPESRLLIASITDHHQIVSLTQWFKDEGVEEDRLTFEYRCGFDPYLTLHHQVDICLDTFPYSGGTTTLYAMWMGVPTLTVVGATPTGRQTAWSLVHVGLNEFVSHTSEEFIHKGLEWTRHKIELAEIRATLRTRLLASNICNPDLISTGFALALRIMWHRWCDGLPAAFIDASWPAGYNSEVQRLTRS